jgi:hypothetical protein
MQNGVPLPGVPGGLPPTSPSGDATAVAPRPAPPPNWPAPPPTRLAGPHATAPGFPSGAGASPPILALTPSPAPLRVEPVPAESGAPLPVSTDALPRPAELVPLGVVDPGGGRGPVAGAFDVPRGHGPDEATATGPRYDAPEPRPEVLAGQQPAQAHASPRARSRVPLLLGVLLVAMAAVGGAALYLSRQAAEETQPESASSSAPKKKGKRSKDAPKATAAPSPAARPTARARDEDREEPDVDASPPDATAEATATAQPTGRPSSLTRPRIGPRPNGMRPTKRKTETGE